MEAAINGIAAVVLVCEFACVENRQLPAFLLRKSADPLRCFLRNRRRHGVKHRTGAARQHPVGQSGESNAIHAAADRNRQRVQELQTSDQSLLSRGHLSDGLAVRLERFRD